MFRSNMTAPEIVVDAGKRSTACAAARSISGRWRWRRGRSSATNGFQLDFEHLDGDELWRRGRAVGAVVNGRLYLIMLDAARSHYYADTIRDFEAIVASARLRR